jgi:hypothetical protein
MAENGEVATPVATPPRRGRIKGRQGQVIERDIAKVEKLLLTGTPTQVIVAKLKHLSSRTVDRYIAQVRAHWKQEMLLRSETAREERAVHLQSRAETLWRERDQPGRLAAYTQIEKHLDDIFGTAAPQQVQVQHSGAVAIVPVPPEAWDEIDDAAFAALERAADKMPALVAHEAPVVKPDAP